MTNRIATFVLLAGVLLAAISATACSAEPESPGTLPRAQPLKVTATTGMIADAAKAIAGDRAQVNALMGPGVDPHLYKATPGDMRTLQNADLVLYNGLHLEGRLADVLVRLAAKKPTVQVTDSIPEDLLREPPEFDGHFDPHVWFDVELWMKVAERTREALISQDAAGKAAYTSNAERYLAELRTLHEHCKTEIARIPKERRLLVTAHDAFGYFGRAYGIEVMAVQGISTDSEGSLKQINSLVDTLVNRKVPAVFIESSVPRRNIDALIEGCKARGHIVKIGGELFSDAMGPPGTSEERYIGMVRHNIKTIVEALALADAGAKPSEPATHPANGTPKP